MNTARIAGNYAIATGSDVVIAAARQVCDGKWVWSSALGRSGHKRFESAAQALSAASKSLGFRIEKGN